MIKRDRCREAAKKHMSASVISPVALTTPFPMDLVLTSTIQAGDFIGSTLRIK